MLEISDNKRQAKVAKDLAHQFVLLTEKMGDGYQIFANWVKSIWKSTNMARNIIVGIIASFWPYIIANKKVSKNHANILKALKKHWNKG